MQEYRRKSDSMRNRHLQSIFDINADDLFAIDVAFKNLIKTLKSPLAELVLTVKMAESSHADKKLKIHIEPIMGRYICTVSMESQRWESVLCNYVTCPTSLKNGFIFTRGKIVDTFKGLKSSYFFLNPFKLDGKLEAVEDLNSILASKIYQQLMAEYDVVDLRHSYLLHYAVGGQNWNTVVAYMQRHGYTVGHDSPAVFVGNSECKGISGDPTLHSYEDIRDFINLFKTINGANALVNSQLQ